MQLFVLFKMRMTGCITLELCTTRKMSCSFWWWDDISQLIQTFSCRCSCRTASIRRFYIFRVANNRASFQLTWSCKLQCLPCRFVSSFLLAAHHLLQFGFDRRVGQNAHLSCSWHSSWVRLAYAGLQEWFQMLRCDNCWQRFDWWWPSSVTAVGSNLLFRDGGRWGYSWLILTWLACRWYR